MDIFEDKTITPMLIAQNQQPFDSLEHIYELKLDGIRCLAYLWADGMELQNKRNKRLNSIYPELQGIQNQVKKRCILDGELVVLRDGKPDFFELQRRSLMIHPVKIEMAAKKLPVCYTAFDILYLDGEQVTGLPLSDRKILLEENVTETPSLAISRFIQNDGISLYYAAKEKGLEGIVAKKIDSKYYCGKRTKEWIKMKNLIDEDFIVCGYYLSEKELISIILGSHDNHKLVYQSHVAMGISNGNYKALLDANKTDKDSYLEFPNFEEAVWLEPKLVCCVQYMERTPEGGLRQPVFRGFRDDKLPKECKVTK